MINCLRKILLFIPLLLLALIWLSVVLGIDFIPDDIFRDDTFEYSGDGKKPSGLISMEWFYTTYFITLIVGFLIGSIYTAYKKYWVWFGAYIILGGLPVMLFLLGTIFG
ncbi:hypothetical protein ACTFQF_19630 [Aliivibrio fischeri]|uniref:hypothetical protein n=1 Tax=Aliivibrio fischeri TaxID=668 RepID=UPI0007C5529A|nr:hypothetical protein [Aliivibrio fischeri]MBP3139598.1 hypothetical protein [Aliivibrio fischeri]MBP3153983.1 hypothetical protein [Aliivibrio fischeri]MCE7573361.1 hypothetical protein [Aliivibrio fischeri]